MQIRGHAGRYLSENAFVRVAGWTAVCIEYNTRSVYLRKDRLQSRQFGYGPAPRGRLKALCARLASLRRKQAEPDLAAFPAVRPERCKRPEIRRMLDHLAGNSTVDDYPVARQVVQNATVSCGGATRVLIWRKTIDRNDKVNMLKFRPTQPECARRRLW